MVEVYRLLSLVLNHCSLHSFFSWCWTLVTLHTLSCCHGFFCIFVFKMDGEERYMTYYLGENRTEPCITKYRLFHKLLIVFSFSWHSPLLPRICLYCLKKWANVPQVHKCTGSPRFPKSQSVATHPSPPPVLYLTLSLIFENSILRVLRPRHCHPSQMPLYVLSVAA